MRAGVVGAGIMGQLVALELVSAGWEVVIFDNNTQLNCSQVAAGLLTPFSELIKNDLVICDLGVQGIMAHWPAIMQRLNSPTPIYFQNQGSLLVAHPQEQAELVHYISTLADKLRHSNYVMQHYIHSVNPSELEPELTKVAHGYYFTLEGCIDNQAILAALRQNLGSNTIWLDTTVDKIANGTVEAGQKVYHFDRVFDCRGMGGRSSFNTLRGVRGELIKVHAPDVNMQRPVRILHPRYSLYIVPRPGSEYIFGASEIDAEDNTPVSVKTLLELLSMAYWLHPGFAEARLLATLTHSRPTLPDQLPRIKYNSKLIAINGLYRHGFLIAPALAADVAAFLHSGISSVQYPSLWEQIDDSNSAE